jgi:hypothetical protein
MQESVIVRAKIKPKLKSVIHSSHPVVMETTTSLYIIWDHLQNTKPEIITKIRKN